MIVIIYQVQIYLDLIGQVIKIMTFDQQEESDHVKMGTIYQEEKNGNE